MTGLLRSVLFIAAAASFGAADGPAPAAPATPTESELPEPKIDAQGRSYATGKRKNAIARVWIKPGSGRFSINGRDELTYFARPVLRMLISQPLIAVNRATQYDVWCTVTGGGLSGQAGAVRHGISRALLNFEPDLRGVLKAVALPTGRKFAGPSDEINAKLCDQMQAMSLDSAFGKRMSYDIYIGQGENDPTGRLMGAFNKLQEVDAFYGDFLRGVKKGEIAGEVLEDQLADAVANNKLDETQAQRTQRELTRYQHLVRVLPRYDHAHLSLGTRHYAEGDLNNAGKSFDRALVLSGQNSAKAHYNRGLVDAALKQLPSAIKRYQRSLELEPLSNQAHHVHFALGAAYYSLDDHAAAETQYLQALAINPRFAVAQLGLGRLYKDTGQRDKARRHLQTAVELLSEDSRGEDAQLRAARQELRSLGP